MSLILKQSSDNKLPVSDDELRNILKETIKADFIGLLPTVVPVCKNNKITGYYVFDDNTLHDNT